MTIFQIHTLDNPSLPPRDRWGIFTRERHEGMTHEIRVFGPANLLDCTRERARLISAERHGVAAATC